LLNMGEVIELEELTPVTCTPRLAISQIDINRCQAITDSDLRSVVVPLKNGDCFICSRQSFDRSGLVLDA
jgi:hypothetical protein